jgi:Ni/Fe-hydrogenase subunit HybB-like protein
MPQQYMDIAPVCYSALLRVTLNLLRRSRRRQLLHWMKASAVELAILAHATSSRYLTSANSSQEEYFGALFVYYLFLSRLSLYS